MLHHQLLQQAGACSLRRHPWPRPTVGSAGARAFIPPTVRARTDEHECVRVGICNYSATAIVSRRQRCSDGWLRHTGYTCNC